MFCYGWIRVAIGIILGIERLPAQDSYDTENCYHFYASTFTIEAHTHTKYLDCSSLEAAPTTYDASFFLFGRSAFFPFSIRPPCDVQTWSFKYRQHWRGRN